MSLYLVAVVLAGVLAWVGARLAGPDTTGSVVGALAGGGLGLAIGLGLVAASGSYLFRRLKKMSVAELRAELRDPAHRTPNLVLGELKRRGEVSPDDLEAVIGMLADESAVRRKRGYLALHRVFPDLLRTAPAFKPTADPAERARAIEALRGRLEPRQRDR